MRTGDRDTGLDLIHEQLMTRIRATAPARRPQKLRRIPIVVMAALLIVAAGSAATLAATRLLPRFRDDQPAAKQIQALHTETETLDDVDQTVRNFYDGARERWAQRGSEYTFGPDDKVRVLVNTFDEPNGFAYLVVPSADGRRVCEILVLPAPAQTSYCTDRFTHDRPITETIERMSPKGPLFAHGIAADGVVSIRVTTTSGAASDATLNDNAWYWIAPAGERPLTIVASIDDGTTYTSRIAQ